MADRDRLACGANCAGLGLLPVKPGSCTKAVPGYDVRVLGDDGRELPAGQTGNVVLKLPLPPGCLPTMWNNDAAYRDGYLSAYPGYYATADAGYTDEDGYLWIMSRTDDIINVAGHRLSTGALEEVLAAHPDVAECAVVGAADALKGEIPLGLAVLKAGVARPHAEIVAELIGMVRERIGPRGVVQGRRRRQAAAQDPIGEDRARNDQENHRRRRVQRTSDDRRPRDARRDHRGHGRHRGIRGSDP